MALEKLPPGWRMVRSDQKPAPVDTDSRALTIQFLKGLHPDLARAYQLTSRDIPPSGDPTIDIVRWAIARSKPCPDDPAQQEVSAKTAGGLIDSSEGRILIAPVEMKNTYLLEVASYTTTIGRPGIAVIGYNVGQVGDTLVTTDIFFKDRMEDYGAYWAHLPFRNNPPRRDILYLGQYGTAVFQHCRVTVTGGEFFSPPGEPLPLPIAA